MSDERVETEQRVEVDYETVEVELYQCPLCEQHYEDENIVPLGIGVQDDGDIDQRDVICTACAESLWDYDPDPDYRDIVFTNLEDISAAAVAKLSAGLGILVGGISLLGMVLLEAMQMVSTAASELGDPPEASGGSSTEIAMETVVQNALSLVPLVFLVVLVASLAAVREADGGFR